MANALKVPTSDLTFAEAKEKYAKKLKRIESMKKDKNCWKIEVEFCKKFSKRTILYHCDQRYYFDIYNKVWNVENKYSISSNIVCLFFKFFLFGVLMFFKNIDISMDYKLSTSTFMFWRYIYFYTNYGKIIGLVIFFP